MMRADLIKQLRKASRAHRRAESTFYCAQNRLLLARGEVKATCKQVGALDERCRSLRNQIRQMDESGGTQ